MLCPPLSASASGERALLLRASRPRMFRCNRCAARRKSRASSVVCPVCKTGELIFEGDGDSGVGGGGANSGDGDGTVVAHQRPPDALLCDHCHKVFVNPVSMPECPHKFCRR